MAKKVIWALVFILAAALLQSSLIDRLSFSFVIPDLTLGILVYTAYVNGTMCGQVTGFFSGLLLDFFSAAPLGYNALVRTFIGAVTGHLRGTFFLDRLFFPMALCCGATFVKALSRNALHFLLTGTVPAYDFTLPAFWVELGLNVATAPFLFAFLKLFTSLLAEKKEIQ